MSSKGSALSCTKCSLCKTRTNVVWGDGTTDASIMFIGEAPGAEEDKTGVPFVGRSGKLLRATMEEAGILPSEVFITNTVMCRPPGNRDPEESEREACNGWLVKKLAEVNPKLIVTVGRFSTAEILGRDVKDIKITKMSGIMQFSRLGYVKCPVVPLLHPSYTLRKGETGKLLLLIGMKIVRALV